MSSPLESCAGSSVLIVILLTPSPAITGSVVMLALLDFIATHTGTFALTVVVVYAAAVLVRDQRSNQRGA